MRQRTLHPMPAPSIESAAMKLNPLISKSGLALALLVLSAAAQSADINAGRAKHEQVCAACHGKDANTPIDPSYPRLAGQHRDYLERTLIDYQTGARKNAIMAAQAQTLSRAEIANLSAFYASLPGSLQVKRP